MKWRHCRTVTAFRNEQERLRCPAHPRGQNHRRNTVTRWCPFCRRSQKNKMGQPTFTWQTVEFSYSNPIGTPRNFRITDAFGIVCDEGAVVRNDPPPANAIGSNSWSARCSQTFSMRAACWVISDNASEVRKVCPPPSPSDPSIAIIGNEGARVCALPLCQSSGRSPCGAIFTSFGSKRPSTSTRSACAAIT